MNLQLEKQYSRELEKLDVTLPHFPRSKPYNREMGKKEILYIALGGRSRDLQFTPA